MKLIISDLGLRDYKEVLELQRKLMKLRSAGVIKDTLLLVEHNPVITMGRRAKKENLIANEEELAKEAVNIYDVERGGDLTYHGPGQIVGYPIFDLRQHNRDIRKYIENLEKFAIEMLREEYGIEAHGEYGRYTGVWCNTDKIMAIGVGIQKWISIHGFALNVNTKLENFDWIVPCGLQDRGVTSIEKLTGKKQDIFNVKQHIIKYLAKAYGFQDIETRDYSKELQVSR